MMEINLNKDFLVPKDGFKPGVFRCSCCNHLIFAFQTCVRPRGPAFVALSLSDGGEGFEEGRLVEILQINYQPVPDTRVSFRCETCPVPAQLLSEGLISGVEA